MSTAYKIDGAFANRKYRGAGHAAAAIYRDRIVDMVYLRDVFDAWMKTAKLLRSPRIGLRRPCAS
jgi:hypothetical protein